MNILLSRVCTDRVHWCSRLLWLGTIIDHVISPHRDIVSSLLWVNGSNWAHSTQFRESHLFPCQVTSTLQKVFHHYTAWSFLLLSSKILEWNTKPSVKGSPDSLYAMQCHLTAFVFVNWPINFVWWLFVNHAGVSVKTGSGKTVLHHAAEHNSVAVMRFLVEERWAVLWAVDLT